VRRRCATPRTMREIAAQMTIFWIKPNLFDCGTTTHGLAFKTYKGVRMRALVQLGGTHFMRAWFTARRRRTRIRTMREITARMAIFRIEENLFNCGTSTVSLAFKAQKGVRMRACVQLRGTHFMRARSTTALSCLPAADGGSIFCTGSTQENKSKDRKLHGWRERVWALLSEIVSTSCCCLLRSVLLQIPSLLDRSWIDGSIPDIIVSASKMLHPIVRHCLYAKLWIL